MHNRLRVRVLHRFARRPKQPKPLCNRAPPAFAVIGDWFTIHVLHRKPWNPAAQSAAFVDPRYERMCEMR